MSKKPAALAKPRLTSIRKHLKLRGNQKPFTSITEFISYIHETSARWQKEDWKRNEADVRDVLNITALLAKCGSVARETHCMVFSLVSIERALGNIW
jgi:hypothetical protein